MIGLNPAISDQVKTDFMTASAPLSPDYTVVAKRPVKLGRKDPSMKIIGCDFHPSFQQIAYVEQETGEYMSRLVDPVQVPRQPESDAMAGL